MIQFTLARMAGLPAWFGLYGFFLHFFPHEILAGKQKIQGNAWKTVLKSGIELTLKVGQGVIND